MLKGKKKGKVWLLSNKFLVKDCGLLEGFCDYHCHLLPGVDDGVQETEEALNILRLWEQVGMKEVWLTPHIMEDIPNTPTELTQRYEILKMTYTGPIRLYLASENMMDRLFLERLIKQELLPVGNSGKNLLVETSFYNSPMNLQEIVDRIHEMRLTPVLAHPERYQYMEMADYHRWKQKGVLLQLNIPSLVGAYGPEVQWKAEKLLEKGMYDFCGTDTHSIRFVEYFLNSKINKKTVKKVRGIPNEL